jgi:hypothetical protein
VLITLQRQSNTRGYFSAKRFDGRVKESVADELAMNPDTFKERTDEEIRFGAHSMLLVQKEVQYW